MYWNDTQHVILDEGIGSFHQHLELAFHSWLLAVFLFLQEAVNNSHMESADFGLSISGINKGNGEENVRPQKVSEIHEPSTKRGNPFSF